MENSDGAAIKVGEMARRVGLSARTIKYYEERGLLCPTQEREPVPTLQRGRRRTPASESAQLRGFGLSVATIEEVLRHPTQRDEDGPPHLPLAVDRTDATSRCTTNDAPCWLVSNKAAKSWPKSRRWPESSRTTWATCAAT